MAEYIDRKKAKTLIEIAIEDNWDLDYTLERLKETNSADVVERSKLNKAIEEINDLNLSWVASHYEDRFYGFQQEVLEILKRNIGEIKDKT